MIKYNKILIFYKLKINYKIKVFLYSKHLVKFKTQKIIKNNLQKIKKNNPFSKIQTYIKKMKSL